MSGVKLEQWILATKQTSISAYTDELSQDGVEAGNQTHPKWMGKSVA
jgi:hypothetical protein